MAGFRPIHTLLAAVAEFESSVLQAGKADMYAGTLQALQEVRQRVSEEHDEDENPTKRCKTSAEQAERRALMKRINYFQNARDDAQAQLDKLHGDKFGRIMDHLWHVRVLLASPTTSLRELSNWCRCLTTDGRSPISHTQIGIVRAAWVCLLQQLRKEEVSARVAAAPLTSGRRASPVYVR